MSVLSVVSLPLSAGEEEVVPDRAWTGRTRCRTVREEAFKKPEKKRRKKKESRVLILIIITDANENHLHSEAER